MATSGTTTFSQKCDEMIIYALDLLNVHGKGMTPDAEDMAYAKKCLNLMIKSWGTSGTHLWTKTEGVLYPSQYQSKYKLNSDSNAAYATNKSDEIITTLSLAFVISDTNIKVADTTGMAVDDYIGIVLNGNNLFWTQIASVVDATTLTLNSYPTEAVSKNNAVYTFTKRLEKPLRILDSRTVNGIDTGATSTETVLMMSPMPYETYMHMSSVATNGRPNQYVYNPERENGTMYLWPRPNDCNYRIEFTYERIIEDLNTATDDFDFPAEWQETIGYQLAVRLAPRWGKEEKVAKLIAPVASELLATLKIWDTEITSVYLMPERGYD